MAVDKLVPDADASDPDALLFTNTYLQIDETVASADGLTNATNADDVTARTATWSSFTAMASGFSAVASATFRVRARTQTFDDDTATYRFRITIASTDYDITFSDADSTYSDKTVSVGTSFTRAQYEAATVTLVQTVHSKTKGFDGGLLQLDAFELEIDYTAVSNDMTATAALVTSETNAPLNAVGELVADDPLTFGQTPDINALGELAATAITALFGEAADLVNGNVSNDMTATDPLTTAEAPDLDAVGELRAAKTVAFGEAADINAVGELKAGGENQWSIDFAKRSLGALASRFSRASDQTGVGTTGDLEIVTSGIPAFDNLDGLILEDTRENKIIQSESVTGWTQTNITATADQATGPDGLTSAIDLVENGSNATHILRRSITLTAEIHTLSVYIKPRAGPRNVGLVYNEEVEGALWDPSDGTEVSNIGYTDAGTIFHGNGWYRAWFSDPTAAAARDHRVYLGNGATWTTAYTGDSSSGAYVWGVQSEAGGFPSTYIPTTTVPATRATCDLDDIDVSADLGLSDKTNDISFHVVVKAPFPHDVDRVSDFRILAWFASATNWLELYFDQTTDQIHLGVVTAGAAEEVASTVLNNIQYVRGDVLNIRGKKDAGGISLWVDSETQVDNVSANAQADFSAALDTLALNEDNAGANKGFVTVRGLTLYDTIKGDAYLNALTAADLGTIPASATFSEAPDINAVGELVATDPLTLGHATALNALGQLASYQLKSSRLFESANSDYLSSGSPPYTNPTTQVWTVAAWVFVNTWTAQEQVLVSVGNTTDSSDFWNLRLDDAGGDDASVAQFTMRNGGVGQGASSINTWRKGRWQHVVGISISGTSRVVVLNGDWANRGIDSTSFAVLDGANRLSVGAFAGTPQVDYTDGYIAHVAMWDVALSQTEIEALAAGARPDRVSPADLTHYWEFDGASLTDSVAALVLTNNGSAESAVVPPVESVIFSEPGAALEAAAANDMTAADALAAGETAAINAIGELVASAGSLVFGELTVDLKAFGELVALDPLTFGEAADVNALANMTASGTLAFGELTVALTGIGVLRVVAGTLVFGETADLNAAGELRVAAGTLIFDEGAVLTDANFNQDMAATSALVLGEVADISALGSLVADSSLVFSETAALRAIAEMVASGALNLSEAADINATAAMTAISAINFTEGADITALADMLATGTLVFGEAADIEALGNLLAADPATFGEAANLNALGELVATDPMTMGHSAAVNALGALLVTANPTTFGESAGLNALGAMLVAASAVFAEAADLKDAGTSDMTSTSPVTFTETNAPLTALGVLTATGTVVYGEVANINALGNLLAGAGAIDFAQVADINGVGELLATSPLAFTEAANLQAIAEALAAGTLVFGQTADINALAALLATDPATFGEAADLTSPAANDITSTAPLTFGEAPTLMAIGRLDATGTLVLGEVADINGAGAMSGAAALDFTSLAALDALAELRAAESLTFTETAGLSAIGSLGATGTLVFGQVAVITDASGTFVVIRSLTGAYLSSIDLTGVTGDKALTGHTKDINLTGFVGDD